MQRVRPLRALAAATALAGLAACGSTVQMGPTAVGAQNGQGLSAPAGVPGQPGAVATAPGGAGPAVGNGAAPAGVTGPGAIGPGSSGTTTRGGPDRARRSTSRNGGLVNATGTTPP